MYWFLEKTEEDDVKAVYRYGKKEDALNGVVCFYKNPRQAESVRLADGETEKGFEFFLCNVWRILIKEEYPDKRLVAIG